MRKIIIVFGVFCVLFGQAVFAYQSHQSKNSYRLLGPVQRERLAQNLVGDLMRQPFFSELELPVRVALARLNIHSNTVPVTATQLTDDVLNQLLKQPHVVVVNQDFSTDINADYRLLSYLTDDEVRRKGVLLGADFYLHGTLQSQEILNSRGKAQTVYHVELIARNIRTDAVMTKAEYTIRAGSSHQH